MTADQQATEELVGQVMRLVESHAQGQPQARHDLEKLLRSLLAPRARNSTPYPRLTA